MNRKGLSNIVSTMLILLLSIAALTLLYTILKPMIVDTTMSPQVSCFDWKVNPPLKLSNACFNSTSNEVRVNVMKIGDVSKVDSLEFTLTKSGSEIAKWQVGGECGQSSFNENREDYYLPFTGLNFEKGSQTIILNLRNCIFLEQNLIEC